MAKHLTYQEALDLPREKVLRVARKLLKERLKHSSNTLLVEFLEEQVYQGYLVELEHGTKSGVKSPANLTNNDTKMTVQIAWAHIIEDPAYYYRLRAMEKRGEKVRETLADGSACDVNRVLKESIDHIKSFAEKDAALDPEEEESEDEDDEKETEVEPDKTSIITKATNVLEQL